MASAAVATSGNSRGRLWLAIFVAVLAYLALLVTAPNMAAPLPLSSKLVPRLQLLTHRFKTSRFLSPVSSSFLQPSTALPTSRRNFSLTAASMSYDKLVVKDAAENRRSIYALTKKSPVSDKRIEEIVHSAIKHVPSSFNSQSTRLVVLLKDDHDKFWDTTTEILKAIVPEDAWGHTEGRLKGFRGAYGTVRCSPIRAPRVSSCTS